MDALSDVLRAVRLSGAVFFDIHAADPWVAETPLGRSVVHAMFPGSEHMICYHVLLEGSCWAILEGESPVQLSAGDVIVFPHGDTHVLTSTPGMRKKPTLSMYRRPTEGHLPFTISMGPMPVSDAKTGAASNGDNATTAAAPGARFVCGFLGCDARPFNPLLTALPRVIRVSDDANGTLAAYVRFALAESKVPRIGGESVLGRLSELMFLHVVRRYLESLPADKTDWLSGLRDEPIGRALAALHRSPARAWTLQSLAREAGISRSVLAERFLQFVGHPPIEYLTSWRMQLAANQLRSSTESVAEIANRVGYESEAAFSRAFKKAVGRAAERVAQEPSDIGGGQHGRHEAIAPAPNARPMSSPLITLEIHEALLAARRAGSAGLECSLDLGRSVSHLDIREPEWGWQGAVYPYLKTCKERTIYYWSGAAFEPVSRYTGALIKLVPTQWGPPTFEIDGIKMLPTATVSPYADAERKVALIQPRGKRVLDTCGGLGYFAAWCLRGQASHVLSFEKNPDVIWLRSLNPWSPAPDAALTLTQGDVAQAIATIPAASIDAILHDPPRFGIAGELYSQTFYDELARVIRRRGRLFHYTGTPNKLTSGRNVRNEVATRLKRAGFSTELNGDGVLAVRG